MCEGEPISLHTLNLYDDEIKTFKKMYTYDLSSIFSHRTELYQNTFLPKLLVILLGIF